MNILHITLLAQSGFRIIPMSHSLEKTFTHSQLQDASLGWGQGFTWHPTSQIPLWWDLLLLAAGLICMLFFVSGGLLAYFWHFCESSPLQSTVTSYTLIIAKASQALITGSQTMHIARRVCHSLHSRRNPCTSSLLKKLGIDFYKEKQHREPHEQLAIKRYIPHQLWSHLSCIPSYWTIVSVWLPAVRECKWLE